MSLAVLHHPYNNSWTRLLCPLAARRTAWPTCGDLQVRRIRHLPGRVNDSTGKEYSSLFERNVFPKNERVGPIVGGGPYLDRQHKDIVPGDLDATLRKHRSSNRKRGFGLGYGDVKKDDRMLNLLDTFASPPKEHPSSDNEQGELGVPVIRKIVPSDSQLARRASHELKKMKAQLDGMRKELRMVEVEEKPEKGARQSRNAREKLKFIKQMRWSNRALHHMATMKGMGAVAATEFFKTSLLQNSQLKLGTQVPWTLNAVENGPDFEKADIRTIFRLELEKAAASLHLTPEEQDLRQQLADQVVNHLQGTIPGAVCRPFGSIQTELGTSLSDIDIEYFLPSITEGLHPRARKRQKLRRAGPALQKLAEQCAELEGFDIEELVFARFPLVRLVHLRSGIEVQVVLSTEEQLEPLSREDCMNTYAAEYSSARDLCLILKALLKEYDLNDPKTGGIGSYTLFMMIIAAFKYKEMPADQDLATSLLEVLQFWSSFDTTKFAMSVDPCLVVPKHPEPNRSQEPLRDCDDKKEWGLRKMNVTSKDQPYLLCLQDPFDHTNDIGKRAFRILHIRKYFGVLAWHIEKRLSGEMTFPESLVQLLFGDSLRRYRETRQRALNAIREAKQEENRRVKQKQAGRA